MISAEQLIYTRVEGPYSPRKSGGYQVVYQPAGFRASDVAYITERIRSFPDGPLDLVRLQYFLTEDQKHVVLTRSQFIDPDVEIVDHNGRRGPFLAHCLILEVDAFERLDCNPFVVFDQGSLFCTDARTMVDLFRDRFTSIPPATVELIAAEELDESCDWPREEYVKLLGLASQAAEHLQKGKSVAFLGEQDAIQMSLRMLFSNRDRGMLRQCTFDSGFVESAFKPGVFWAIGLAKRTVRDKYIEVDAGRRKVLVEVPRDQSGGLYAQWFANALKRDGESVAGILRRAPTIRQFVEVLEKKKPYSAALVWNPRACREFYGSFPDLLRRELRARLLAVLGKGYVEDLAAFIERGWQRGDSPWWLETPLHSRALADWLVAWICHEQPTIKFSGLAALARATECWPLLFWAACPDTGYLHLNWSGSKDDRFLALSRMSAQDFHATLHLLGHPIAAKYFLHSKHLAILLEAMAQSFPSEAEWLALVRLVIENKHAHELGPLAVNVPHVTRTGIRQLEAMLAGVAHVNAEFAQAIQDRCAPSLPPLTPAVALS